MSGEAGEYKGHESGQDIHGNWSHNGELVETQIRSLIRALATWCLISDSGCFAYTENTIAQPKPLDHVPSETQFVS